MNQNAAQWQFLPYFLWLSKVWLDCSTLFGRVTASIFSVFSVTLSYPHFTNITNCYNCVKKRPNTEQKSPGIKKVLIVKLIKVKNQKLDVEIVFFFRYEKHIPDSGPEKKLILFLTIENREKTKEVVFQHGSTLLSKSRLRMPLKWEPLELGPSPGFLYKKNVLCEAGWPGAGFSSLLYGKSSNEPTPRQLVLNPE